MANQSVISFDGSWSHRRHAKEHIVIVIDCMQKKIVDFEIKLKAKGKVPGNYRGSPNGMEMAALNDIIRRWTRHEWYRRLAGCVHDNDSKATNAVEAAHWPNVKQYYDLNHVSKQFETVWKRCPHTHLRGIHDRLLIWFQFLIQSDYSAAERERYWMNSLEHFQGNHAGCPRRHLAPDTHPPIHSADSLQELTAILEQTIGLLSRARHGFDQQMCESFNAVKAKFASKDISWGVTWAIRVMCAILQMNSETDWRVPLAETCGITLDPVDLQEMEEAFRKEKALNQERRTAEAQKKAREYRRLARQREKAQNAGRDDYHIASEAEDGDEADGTEETREPEWMTNDEAVRRDETIAVRPEASADGWAFFEPIVRNRDYQGSNEPQPRQPIAAVVSDPPFIFESPDGLVIDAVECPPSLHRFTDASLIGDHPSDVVLGPAEPFNPLPSGPALREAFERATQETLRRQALIDQEAADEELRDDAEDEEVAELPGANLLITDDNFVFRMEDKTLVMEAR
jgi:hypothetical protein